MEFLFGLSLSLFYFIVESFLLKYFDIIFIIFVDVVLELFFVFFNFEVIFYNKI